VAVKVFSLVRGFNPKKVGTDWFEHELKHSCFLFWAAFFRPEKSLAIKQVFLNPEPEKALIPLGQFSAARQEFYLTGARR
jgi:hypothetical protein